MQSQSKKEEENRIGGQTKEQFAECVMAANSRIRNVPLQELLAVSSIRHPPPCLQEVDSARPTPGLSTEQSTTSSKALSSSGVVNVNLWGALVAVCVCE